MKLDEKDPSQAAVVWEKPVAVKFPPTSFVVEKFAVSEKAWVKVKNKTFAVDTLNPTNSKINNENYRRLIILYK